ncbi:MAG: ATP-binding protein [Clostridia bacterium]|nr:ATP-binding protein [Clostridia bacterium]
MKELKIEAVKENLETVMRFVSEEIENIYCPLKVQMQIEISVEEVFINIANYAYAPQTGYATICVDIMQDPSCVKIVFIDEGVHYDPLAKEDPDITLSAAQRAIGGLGIFMVKKSMDEIYYERKDDKNVLTLIKYL